MGTDELTGVQKAAILLITLGPEKSADIFKHLKEEEIEELTLEIARVIRLGFLQQNAFHAEDTCVPMEKQFKMMETILYLYEKCRALITRGMPVSILKEGNNIFEKIISIKYDVANNQLEKFDQYKQDIDTFYDDIIKRNG